MSLFFSSAFAQSRTPHVVVVGAGLAGLTTAYRLQEQGIEVFLYEARGRVGGRILSAEIDGQVVELGGQNIRDGGAAQNMLRLIEEFDLELKEYEVNLNHAYFTGKELVSIRALIQSCSFQADDLKNTLDALQKKCRTMREVLDGFFGEENILYKSLAARLGAYEGATIDALSSHYTETLYHMLLGGVAAAHASEPFKNNTLTLSSIKRGNSLLPECLAKALNGKLHLNQALKQISKQDNRYLLTFSDARVVADIVVLAIPCSVYTDIAFDADVIPAEKLEAMQKIGYGTNAKILMRFSDPFKQEGGFLNDRMLAFFHQEMCTLYYIGEASYFTPESIIRSLGREKPMLELGFGSASLPVIPPLFARDVSFASYQSPIGYSWPADPYAKGSYSYILPGQEALLTTLEEIDGEPVKALFSPIDRSLYFAGEHATILLDIPGTMEAACESGERTARLIAAQIRGYINPQK